tara:strand:+ start:173 stop:346 length:174 start_codon:yes stop_codon:yes gene_type:complete
MDKDKKTNKEIFDEILKKKKENIDEKNYNNSKEAKSSNFSKIRSNSPQRTGKGRRGK